jgi:hypothetical protein
MAKILLSLLALATMTGAASAQQRTIYDSRGNVVGRSVTCIFLPLWEKVPSRGESG